LTVDLGPIPPSPRLTLPREGPPTTAELLLSSFALPIGPAIPLNGDYRDLPIKTAEGAVRMYLPGPAVQRANQRFRYKHTN
jgi:hypothetical protein